jgi:hypothetical protein
VGLERGSLSLVSTTEELLERKISSSGLESREYGRSDASRCPRSTLFYPQKLTLTSPTSGGRYVGIVRADSGHRVFFWDSKLKSEGTFCWTNSRQFLDSSLEELRKAAK